jgi:hypothetical protein
MDDLLRLLVQLLNAVTGALLGQFRRNLDRAPTRDFSQLTVTGRIGRLILMVSALLLVIVPLAWLIWH